MYIPHIGPEDNFCSTKVSKDSVLAKWAKIPLNLTSEGLKCPPEVRVEHKTCSTICGTPVQAILDNFFLPDWQGGQGGSKYGPEWASLMASEPSRDP